LVKIFQTVLSTSPTLLEEIFQWITDAVDGFVGIFTTIFSDEGIISVFYTTEEGMSFVGGLLLLGLGLVFVRFAFHFIIKLIKMKG